MVFYQNLAGISKSEYWLISLHLAKSYCVNPYLHSKLSAKKRGGKPDDYYAIHSFMDSTKELCSDNRHRILHNHWGIRRVIIPIFGHTLLNSDGKEINVKDMLEQDHLLPDYGGKFIPVLSDFTDEMSELTKAEVDIVNQIYGDMQTKEEKEIMLSPLDLTGDMKALRITFNSWFVRTILPRLIDRQPSIENKPYLALFEGMNFALWMDNGAAKPKSALNIAEL